MPLRTANNLNLGPAQSAMAAAAEFAIEAGRARGQGMSNLLNGIAGGINRKVARGDEKRREDRANTQWDLSRQDRLAEQATDNDRQERFHQDSMDVQNAANLWKFQGDAERDMMKAQAENDAEAYVIAEARYKQASGALGSVMARSPRTQATAASVLGGSTAHPGSAAYEADQIIAARRGAPASGSQAPVMDAAPAMGGDALPPKVPPPKVCKDGSCDVAGPHAAHGVDAPETSPVARPAAPPPVTYAEAADRYIEAVRKLDEIDQAMKGQGGGAKGIEARRLAVAMHPQAEANVTSARILAESLKQADAKKAEASKKDAEDAASALDMAHELAYGIGDPAEILDADGTSLAEMTKTPAGRARLKAIYAKGMEEYKARQTALADQAALDRRAAMKPSVSDESREFMRRYIEDTPKLGIPNATLLKDDAELRKTFDDARSLRGSASDTERKIAVSEGGLAERKDENVEKRKQRIVKRIEDLQSQLSRKDYPGSDADWAELGKLQGERAELEKAPTAAPKSPAPAAVGTDQKARIKAALGDTDPNSEAGQRIIKAILGIGG